MWKSGYLPSSKQHPGDGFLADGLFGLLGREALLSDSDVLEASFSDDFLQRLSDDEMNRVFLKYPSMAIMAGVEMARLVVAVFAYKQLLVAERRRFILSTYALAPVKPEDLASLSTCPQAQDATFSFSKQDLQPTVSIADGLNSPLEPVSRVIILPPAVEHTPGGPACKGPSTRPSLLPVVKGVEVGGSDIEAPAALSETARISGRDTGNRRGRLEFTRVRFRSPFQIPIAGSNRIIRMCLDGMLVRRGSIAAVSRIGRSVIECYVRSGEADALLEKLAIRSLEVVTGNECHSFVVGGRAVVRATVIRLAFLYSLAKTRNLRECILEGYPASIVEAVLERGDPRHEWINVSKWDRLRERRDSGNIRAGGLGISEGAEQGGVPKVAGVVDCVALNIEGRPEDIKRETGHCTWAAGHSLVVDVRAGGFKMDMAECEEDVVEAACESEERCAMAMSLCEHVDDPWDAFDGFGARDVQLVVAEEREVATGD
jgi:hypothetical protein